MDKVYLKMKNFVTYLALSGFPPTKGIIMEQSSLRGPAHTNDPRTTASTPRIPNA
jgi:hypothetical protein